MLFLSKKKIRLNELIPNEYVDIHSHLLPNIDDGVKTVHQSAYIIEQLHQLGIKKIITTPHVMKDVWPNTTAIINSKCQEMAKVLTSLDISVKLEASAEYMLDDLFYERIKEKDIIPLPKKYLLVEMSTFSPPLNLNEMLFEIKLAGFTPILAHPERYSFYQDDMNKYKTLKDQGVFFQLNLLSLSGYYGEKVKSTAIKLLNNDYFDFAGSDIHNHQQLEILEKGFLPKNASKIKLLMKNNSIFS